MSLEDHGLCKPLVKGLSVGNAKRNHRVVLIFAQILITSLTFLRDNGITYGPVEPTALKGFVEAIDVFV